MNGGLAPEAIKTVLVRALVGVVAGAIVSGFGVQSGWALVIAAVALAALLVSGIGAGIERKRHIQRRRVEVEQPRLEAEKVQAVTDRLAERQRLAHARAAEAIRRIAATN
ncbi:hypothetical protein [Mycobacterium sp. HUMS_1102779]|uniref:hypothetical protein n=1 Tax=Mycobacterium sp. HUMS_1102779 TaxID=3383487 RepID=UPI00389A6489